MWKEEGDFMSYGRIKERKRAGISSLDREKKWKVEAVPHNKVRKENTEN